MKDLKNCSNCGGSLSFSPQKQAIWCEHCGSTYPIELPSKNVKITRKYSLDYMPELASKEISQYYCKTCGTSHIVTNGKVSTRCPSCGSKDIETYSSDTYSPDGIVTFKIDKQQATSCFDKWIKKRKFAPSDLYTMAKQGKISSVYVPVYNINATNVCFYNGTVKKVHVDKETNTVFSTVHMVKDVETTQVKNLAISANSMIEDDLIGKIMDIDSNQIVPYSSSYLFGYSAANTDENLQSQVETLRQVCCENAERQVRSKLSSKYDEIVNLTCASKLENIFFNYLYVPIYVNHYKYKDKNYHCYISGIDGKTTGKSPKSVGKILATIGGVLGAIGLIGFLIAKLVLKF